jgi:tetratricopeptide (TPR) repeat protein
MNVKISRNDPCTCGSGKKYKKCCGVNEAISITHIIENEMDDLLKQLIHYGMSNFQHEIMEGFDDIVEDVIIPDEEEQENLSFIYAIWFILLEILDDGETILEKFVRTESGKIKRPKLRQVLKSWTGARTIAGEIIGIKNKQLTVMDVLSKEQLEVLVLSEKIEITEGVFFMGLILPYDEQYIFFPLPFEIPSIKVETAINFITESSFESGYVSPQEFLNDFFIETMSELTFLDTFDIEHLEWSAPIYREVAEIYQQEMESQGEIRPVIDLGIALWNRFCQLRQKRIQNPAIYVAALKYLIYSIAPTENSFSQKELAKIHNVSAGSISSKFQEMKVVLEDELNELDNYGDEDYFEVPELAPQMGKVLQMNKNTPMVTERVLQDAVAELQNKDFDSLEEINTFLSHTLNNPNPAGRQKSDRDQAQDMIYEAFEAAGKERVRLAEKALEIYPYNADAYGILAQQADNLQTASQLFEKGMRVGKEDLGSDFFDENSGHFWGILESRPYMRAKYGYAETLYEMGEVKQASQHFEELLKLNPNDNQGVRYTLFIAYVDTDEMNKAKKLLIDYPDGDAAGLFNKLLIELFEKGFTAKADKLLKEAKKQNKFVVDYLTRKKSLPKHEPEDYGWGDKDEAIIYASNHLHLWEKVVGAEEWLKK